MLLWPCITERLFHKKTKKNRDGQYVVPNAKQLCSAVLIQIILLIRSNYSTPQSPTSSSRQLPICWHQLEDKLFCFYDALITCLEFRRRRKREIDTSLTRTVEFNLTHFCITANPYNIFSRPPAPRAYLFMELNRWICPYQQVFLWTSQ